MLVIEGEINQNYLTCTGLTRELRRAFSFGSGWDDLPVGVPPSWRACRLLGGFGAEVGPHKCGTPTNLAKRISRECNSVHVLLSLNILRPSVLRQQITDFRRLFGLQSLKLFGHIAPLPIPG